ncbi:MAG: hypothetical protein ACO1QB_08520 [Verrucomicrobiales bacterium]
MLTSPVLGKNFPPTVSELPPSRQTGEIDAMISRFLGWLQKQGYESYDPYDIWGTSLALKGRALYYRKNPLGFAVVAPLIAMEILAPSTRALVVKKERFATADAQLILAFLNLYQVQKNPAHLQEAQKLAEEMLHYSIPGYSGYCWGYPFDWQNQRALWPKNTPFITCTPYCFEVFLKLYDITGEARHLQIAESIGKFVYQDLKDIHTGPTSAAGSYSPLDQSKVVNAGAYRAMVLFEASCRFDEPSYAISAQRNLNYILEAQRNDGSWLYATDGHGDFIDHFHTCFVLKNLGKINERLNNELVGEAIQKGWAYYQKNLFDRQELPKTYAVQPRTQIVRLEMYNMAEAITLGSLLRDQIPEAYYLAHRLARKLPSYQLPDGHFTTRTYVGGVRHTFPFIRWPQAQLFYALTNLLQASQSLAKEKSLVG